MLRMDFISEVRTQIMRAVRKEQALCDEQMFDFGASYNELAIKRSPVIHIQS